MTKQFLRNQIMLAKRETSYGVDSAPAAANAIKAMNATIEAMAGDSETRELVVPYMGAQPSIPTGIHSTLQFEVEMTGAGGAGTVPGYGVLMRAAGFSETVTADVEVDYAPVSTGFDSATLHFHQDGTRHVLRGARGGLGMRFEAGRIPRWVYRYRGLDTTLPAAAALPAATYTGFADPQAVSRANTPTFTLDGYAAVMRSLTLEPYEAGFRDLVNEASVQITDHPMRGTVVIDAPAIGTKDFFALARTAAQVPMSLVHGTAAGRIVELAAQKVEIGRPTYGNDNGIVTLSIPIALIPQSAAEPELTVTVR